jgi:hypothetical protein
MFYVYELRDGSGIPFYVGKGKGNRIFVHENKARSGKVSRVCCKIRKLWKIGQSVLLREVCEAASRLFRLGRRRPDDRRG